MARVALQAAIIGIICLASLTLAVIPGLNPVEFHQGEDIPIKVNRMTSVHTQLPYKYYELEFCKPENVVDDSEYLGEVLRGDRIESSVYKVTTLKNEPCKVACTQMYNQTVIDKFKEKIKYEYRVNMLLDNLPAAIPRFYSVDDVSNKLYETGFPIGEKFNEPDSKGKDEDANYYLNNHIDIKVLWHTDKTYEGYRIVGFEVQPKSIQHSGDFKEGSLPSTCNDRATASNLLLQVAKGEQLRVVYTYSVTWDEDTTVDWSHRWSRYVLNTEAQIHWFSIINSLMIVLFLTGMVAMIMMRTLRADVVRYNSTDANEEAEETGWKLVYGDVFRPPNRPMLLAVLIGSGVQVFGMVMVTMVFAVLGFLSPANRGGLVTAGIVLYVLMGIFAGYFSTRNYKLFKGQAFKKNTLMTALFFPGVVFGMFLFLNFLLMGQKSSGAVPFLQMFMLIALWFGISVPLVFLGSYFANKKPVPENPLRTNQIPRQIPEQLWYMHPIFSVMMGGILPFGAVFIELFFILSAIWGQQFYYLFTFLFIVFLILVVTCAEITIVMCYFQLCSEDYHWWWRSFLTAGASAVYMFLYSIFYFVTKLQIQKVVSGFLYFGYTFIMSFAFFVLTGTVGYYACLFFVRKIYSQIKAE
eukprot:TRINITY_DN829_c0_g1_i1.p1 TRINITY_DN829_c0_g1~~TRINITY_DN829_c0_g1_i1.p1  ORF type:complete len:637 (-),score=175.06 TRINITY_DN829_c0_g1_i1:148-2058(-)